MENLSVLKLPYEAHIYTQRKLVESSQMLLPVVSADSRDTTARRLAPLKADVGSSEMAICKDVESYRKLLELVAEIAALNPQYQLFFRGQTNAWNKGELERHMYAGLWRNEPLEETLQKRIRLLNNKSGELVDAYAHYYVKDRSANHYLDRLKKSPSPAGRCCSTMVYAKRHSWTSRAACRWHVRSPAKGQRTAMASCM